MTIDDALHELEIAIENKVPKATLLAIIARSVNLPKPLLATAYIQLQRMSDVAVQQYSKQALQLVRRMQAGEPLADLLAEMGIPEELEGVISSYAKTFRPQND